jgi:hypothetical protein
MSDTITACPECDSCSIKPRNPGKPSSPPSHTTNWYCNECGAQFDEPVERARHTKAGGRSGLARDLVEAESGDLVTDGGQPTHRLHVDNVEGDRAATVEITENAVAGSGPIAGLITQLVEREFGERASRPEPDLRADGGQAWRPVAGHYAPERSVWLVLYARYGPEGWEFSTRVEEPDATMLRSERGAVAEGEPDLRTDGGSSYCRACHRAVAREDRVEVGGDVYHRQCAPDEAVANRQVGEFETDGGTPAATCTHCGEAFPPEGECRSGRGHNFVAFDGGRSVADLLSEHDDCLNAVRLREVVCSERSPESLDHEDWTTPVELTTGAVCLAIDTGIQTIHIGHDGEGFRFTSEIYRQGYGGSRPVDDVAEIRALVGRYGAEPVLRETTPFADSDEDAPLVTDGGDVGDLRDLVSDENGGDP